MGTRFFLDTNILLYAISSDPTEADKKRIAATLLENPDWVLSTQVVQEFYANAIAPKRGRPALMTPELAREFIELLCADRDCLPVDLGIVLDAIDLQQRYPLSYWDSAILTAARRMGCQEVLSEDLANGCVYGGIRVINPFLNNHSTN